MMDRQRRDRRKRAMGGGGLQRLWLPLLGVVFVMYCVFLTRVHYYANSTETHANTLGGSPLTTNPSSPLPTRALEPAPAMRASLESTIPTTVPTQPAVRIQQTEAMGEPAIQVGAINKQPVDHVETPPPSISIDAAPPVTLPPVQPASEAPLMAPMVTSTPLETKQPPPSVQPSATAAPIIDDVKNMIGEAEEAVAPTAHPETTTLNSISFGGRHDVIAGYDQTMDYLDRYVATPDESLFLFFTCSDKFFNPYDWSETCTGAAEMVYDVFAKSPKSNRLVTILAGSKYFWAHENGFHEDYDLRLKTVPSILRWHGKSRETSGMLIKEALLEEPYLRYLFKNTDKPDKFLTPAAMVESKHIETVSSYTDYQDTLASYAREPAPRSKLYVLFVSGRLEENNRPWCPSCRYSELPMEYGFYAFAPPNARLLRVEVTKTYGEWKVPNQFNQDQSLGLRSVPSFYTTEIDDAGVEITLERVYEKLDNFPSLPILYNVESPPFEE